MGEGIPKKIWINPRTMISNPGKIVPQMAPEELKKAENLMLRKFAKVASQIAIQITIITKALFSASAGLKTYAIAEAAKAKTAGYHGKFSTHCIKIATNPHLSPNASRTQRKTPPFRGHPEASSADTSADGIKKKRQDRVK